MSGSTSPDDYHADFVQYLIHPVLRPRLDAWLAEQGLTVGRVPDLPDDLPTYAITPTDDLIALVRARVPQTERPPYGSERRTPWAWRPERDLMGDQYVGLPWPDVDDPDALAPSRGVTDADTGVALCSSCLHPQQHHCAGPYVNHGSTEQRFVVICCTPVDENPDVRCPCVTLLDDPDLPRAV